MKNKFIKILANLEGKKDQKLYALLLDAYSQVASVRQIYHYQLGYTPSKFENLVYEIKKSQNITDKEVALYVPGDEDADETPTLEISISGSKTVENVDTRTAEDIAAQLKQENPILAEIHNLPDVQTGLKLRDEYPFLDDANTPDAIKALVTDKFTAYRNYAALHAEALEAANETEAADKLFELASDAVKNYQLNIDIKDEFDHYRDTEGKVLGKHPKLKDLKIEQEIDQMSEADLIKHRGNAMKSIPKYDPKEKPEKFAEWTLRLKLVEKNLLEKFNRTFEKK
jgi:hypothetical protein